MSDQPSGPRKVRDLEECDDFDFYDKSRRKVIDLSQYAKPGRTERPGGLRARVRGLEGFEDAPVGDLMLPLPYQVGGDGGLVAVSYDSNGQEQHKPVCRHPVLLGCTMTDVETGQQQLQVVFKAHGRWQTATMESALTGSPRELVKALRGVGAPVVASEAREVADFLGRLETENTAQSLPRRRSAKCGGWHRADGEDVFLLGNEALLASGDCTQELMFDGADQRDRVAKSIGCEGSAASQLATVRKAFDASLPAATGILGALAAPLLKPLGVPCFVIHLLGPSSRGKSTVLQVAAGIYGNPDLRVRNSFIAQWNATPIGLEFRTEACCDLPMCIDEAGLMAPEKRQDVVYQIVSGGGKTRGAKNGGTRYTPTWRTVVLSTGETELVQSSASRSGAQVRVLQPRVDGLGDLAAQDVDELKRSAYENYGHMGRQWVLSLLREQDWAAERERFRDLRREFQAQCQQSTLDSRQAEMFAVLAYVETRAHRYFGVGDPHGGTMRQWLQRQEERVRVAPEWERALDAVSERIQRRRSAYPELVEGPTRGKVVKGSSQHAASVDIEGYVDDEASELVLFPGAMAKFLGEYSLDAEVVVREWKRQGLLVSDGADRCTVRRRVGGSRLRYYVLPLEAVQGGERARDFA